MGVQEVLLETGRRGASRAWGSAELPRGGDNVGGTLKGAAGVSSHCRGRISRTSQLIRCRSRRRKAEVQRVKRFQDRTVSKSEDVTNVGTENGKIHVCLSRGDRKSI